MNLLCQIKHSQFVSHWTKKYLILSRRPICIQSSSAISFGKKDVSARVDGATKICKLKEKDQNGVVFTYLKICHVLL